jgi:hypothetical protein
MIRQEIPLKKFRLSIFPLIILIEIALIVLFLAMPFYEVGTYVYSGQGYSLFFGWLLAVISLLVIVGSLLLFLSAFNLSNSPVKDFFHSEKRMQIVGYSTIFGVYLQIVSLAITQIYHTIFYPAEASTYLLILAFSLLMPVLLYFMANFETESEAIYALSDETPTRLKLSALWLIFLTCVMQIFSTLWEILIVGLVLLVVSYFFFQLNRYSVSLVPIVLIIHFVLSAIMTVVAFMIMYSQNELLADIEFDFGFSQQILFIVFVLIIPGIISLVLAQSLFRKWLLAWVRSLHPEPEMEITLEYVGEEEE